MGTGGQKPRLFSQLSTIEAWLSVFLPVAAFLALVFWTDGQPLRQPLPGEGAIEFRENPQAILVAAVFSIVALIFCGTALLLRRRLERLTLAALITGFIGIVVGGIAAGNATKDVVTLTSTGVTVSASPWPGGATKTKLIYAQAEWLRERQTVRWERDWSPRRYVMALMTGEKKGWQRIATDERFIKMRGGEEVQITLTGMPFSARHQAWREIITAMQAAGVEIKPIERIVLSQPPD